MKALKTIVLALVALIVLVLIVAAFSATEYTITREVTIARPQQQVFNYIKLQKNQEEYSKWVMADPSMKKNFRGIDGQVGFVYSWDSTDNEVGAGVQEITNLTNNSVACEIRFKRPFEGVANTVMTAEATTGTQTKVSWSFNGKTPWPMNTMLLFVDMNDVMGSDMQTSLNNLKSNLEQQ